jgi:hypothetical protein
MKRRRFLRSTSVAPFLCVNTVSSVPSVPSVRSYFPPVPRGMMSSRPASIDRPAHHRTERARRHRRAFVYVHDEADEHDDGCEVMKDITDRDRRRTERPRHPQGDT